ncbi:heterodisulfide reductase-related iron-sulfur binding cluster [Halosimplex pelagicum]|uniref:4Fe-4S dicluster domain-containing protein n=1 Tax=Halosimplex pelagicum TaxID=869886 RepID=A0A7D5P9Q3_9EURY|nr:heterodisulfide reductase-related iron-sulfur binding cluster [Halosimplex pelagicum]QLH80658.1 4Fe-4S dicluster domain-containing protein [Halosimplex pelagicum]
MLLLQADAVTRPTFWGIGPVGKAAFYYLAAVAIAVFLLGSYRRVARYAEGSEDPLNRLDDLPGRVVAAAGTVLSNRTLRDGDLVAGLAHAFVLWGFLTLLIATTILGVDMDIYGPLTGESFFVGDFYLSYSFVVDAMGLLFVVGLGVLLYRRYAARDGRLWGRHTSAEDDLFVWALFLLGVGGYLTEGWRILGQDFPAFETVSFVGWAVAVALDGAGMTPTMAEATYPLVWWSHSILALAFIAAVPLGKPFHMLASAANVVARDEDAGRRLPGVPADLDATNAESIDDFTWKELLDQDACTKCGRCSAACPAKAAGRPLDPRDVILDLKNYRESRDAGGEAVDIVADGGTSVVDAATMESCMSCMACMDACPVEIEHLDSFTRMNRQLVDQGDLDRNVQNVFQNVMQQGNTFGESQRNRADWADDLDSEPTDAREESVEYLWYVGDYPSFDDRNRKVARSLARIFERADVDYGILYDDEVYDGNDVRRVGEEFLFVEQAATLVDTFDDCEFERIVCTDPHAFNTFANEYPELDFEEFADDPMMEVPEENWSGAPVFHWTQVVEDLVSEGRLGLRGDELDYTVTYHDPCHLGRYNGEYEAPRDLVRATGCDLAEMPRNRSDSFCCGGGGGGLWMEFDEDPKPSEERLREALEDTAVGPAVEKFVVACPMCTTMFEDGRKTGGFEDDIEVVDVAELLIEAIEVREGGGVAAGKGDTAGSPADD